MYPMSSDEDATGVKTETAYDPTGSANGGAAGGVFRRVLRRVKSEPLVPQRSGVRKLSVSVLALLVVGSGTAAAVEGMRGLQEGVALRIGEVTMTEDQLAHRVKVLGVLYGVQRPPADQGKKVDSFNRDTAKAVAVGDVMEKAAADRGIVIPRNVAASQVDKMARQAGPHGKRQFVAKLSKLGISEQDVVAEVKRQMTNTRLYQEITKKVKPANEAELRRAFDARKARMVTPEKRHMRNIVLPNKGAAEDVARRARSGEDFAKLARENSIDGSTKNSGGDIGTLAANQLEKPYRRSAFGADANSVFGPVRTNNGWNVGQVLKVTPRKPLNYKQVKDALRGQVDSERKAPVWERFLSDTLANADVEYAEKYRPEDPTAPPNIGG